jgi:hypothetical protein
MSIRGDAHNTSVSVANASTISDNPPPPEQNTEGMANGALSFEIPRWVAITSESNPESYRQLRTPVIDMSEIKGLDSNGNDREGAEDELPTILAKIDPKTEILHITEDSPTNDQWEALGRHFTGVRYLKVATGFEENWIDDKFPLHWPLDLLLICDAVGERVTTPAILEGRVRHLVLNYTSGLRFEGPTTRELMENAEVIDFIPREKKKDAPDTEQLDDPALGEGDRKDSGKEPDGIKIFSVPYEWQKWFNSKYGGKAELDFGGSVSGMKRLEILGNDAIETFHCLALAKHHLVAGLESLTLHSPSENDLHYTTGALFLQLLRDLEQLKHLRLTLGSAMVSELVREAADAGQLLHPSSEPSSLAAFLPPNLETLRFRGPVSMASYLEEGFAAALAVDEKVLASLKRISLVLDLPGDSKGAEDTPGPSLDELRVAKQACAKVLDAAAGRGVMVEPFCEPWAEEMPHPAFAFQVDKRWAEI